MNGNNKIEQEILLKDGGVATDPRLGRLVQFDERSRDYPVRDLLPTPELKGRRWYSPRGHILDQGVDLGVKGWNASGCTGFSRTYDLAGSPNPVKAIVNGNKVAPDNEFAFALYKLAQQYDEWPGEDYEGSSVLGALKATKALGFIGEYRWAFGIDDVCSALSTLGPVVVGSNWLDSMFDPSSSGLVNVDMNSDVAGGHAFEFDQVMVSKQSINSHLFSGEAVGHSGDVLLSGNQSWGQDWGKNGRYFFWASDLEKLLNDSGEAAVTTAAFHK